MKTIRKKGSNRMQFVGTGVYSISEAARYIGTSSQRLRYWFKADKRNLFDSDYRESEINRAISFYDLIDALVVSQLRDLGIKFKHIREVQNYFVDKWRTPHPFCTRRFYVDVSQKRIIEEIQKDEDERWLVDALVGQGQIEQCIMKYLKELDYRREEPKMARLWRIAEGVSIDPEIQFGKPVVSGTRITTMVLASQYYAYGKNEARVADLYEVIPSDVMHAVKFERAKGTVKGAA